MDNHPRKTILFFPLNSPGHINSSLGLADRLVSQYPQQFRTVFLLLGKVIGDSVLDHGHELEQLDELHPMEDYDIEEGEDPSQLDEARKLAEGKQKRQFPGALKWPQIINRFRDILSRDPLDALLDSMIVMEKYMVDELVDNHDNYRQAIERIAPDLIIIDAYFIPPCIINSPRPWMRLYSANTLQVLQANPELGVRPIGQVGFSLLRDKATRARLRQEEPEKWQEMLDEWRQAEARFAEAAKKATGGMERFLASQGCQRLPEGQQAHDSPHLNLYMCPRELDYDREDDILRYPPRWFRCESLLRSSPGADLESHNDWNRRLDEAMEGKSFMIYFSLGSIAGGDRTLVRRFLDMFKDDQHKERLYVVSKGVNGDQLELNGANMIGANYVPQTTILKRANLAIIHGGNNSLTECFYFGVPVLVLPVFSDQLDNAQRVADLGLGKRLHVHKSSKVEMMQAIEETLKDESLRERMRTIGAEMRARDDLVKAASLVKRLAEEGRLDEALLEECRNKSGAEIKI